MDIPRIHQRGSGDSAACGIGGKRPQLADSPSAVTCVACRRGWRAKPQAAEVPSSLTDSQRWQVGEARAALAAWDAERNPDGDVYGTERTLADHVRNLLAIVDQEAAPAAAGEEDR